MKKLAVVVLLAAVAWIVWTRRPNPIAVETAKATVGPLSVWIVEEGEARARDRFVVAAPVTGRMARIVLREGERVATGQTITRISPVALDPRSKAEGESRVAAAEAAAQEAEDRAGVEKSQFGLARRERERAEKLYKTGDVALERVDQARSAERTAQQSWDAAVHRLEAARQDVKTARAALLAGNVERPAESVAVRSPVSGRVLTIFEESERVVTAGAPLVAVGDAGRLEVVVDVLSSDAVRIVPGARVLLEGWGGDQDLRAVVRVIEPQAFRKVSALGVEERRVHVVADFVDPPGRLGDAYRVEARIELWRGEKVVKVPADASFRDGEKWAVFVVDGGVAKRRIVEIGHRGADEVEVTEGLKEGETAIVRPPRDLAEGVAVHPATN
ncbi:MAG: efflux RND transporter periplasmic adaptor subunit [Bryobacteraceae bacterium]